MNSKISFRKVMGEDFRQRIWLIVFFGIIGFLTFPVFSHFSLQNMAHTADLYKYETASYLRDEFTWFLLGSRNPWMHIFCVIGAVLSAITGYAFLHSKEKSDFFQSIGIKRWKMYSARWICGWLIFILPYVANVLITYFLVLPVNGAFDTLSAVTVFTALGLFVLGFTAVYCTCVLACVLTGRIIVALIIMAMIFVYVPVCAFTLSRMVSLTYDKLYLPAVFSSAGELFSPVGALIRAGVSSERLDPVAVNAVIALAVWAVAAFTLSLIVYRFRSSEAAGRATSFSVVKPVVKIAFGIAAGLAVGTLASEFSYYENGARFAGGWFWFWSILTIVLVQIIFEAIYNKDIKDVFRRWKSFLIMLGGLIAAAVILVSDPIGANSWFPEKESVARMSVSDTEYTYSEITGESLNMTNGPVDSYFGTFWRTYDIGTQSLTDMLLDDYEGLYAVAENAYENDTSGISGRYVFGYQLKDGNIKYRVYDIDQDKLTDVLHKLSESKEFKEKYYPAFSYNFGGMTELRIFPTQDPDDFIYSKTKTHSLTDEQLNELVESYRSDCERYSLQEINEIEKKSKCITMELQEKSGYENNLYVRLRAKEAWINVYPEFTNTIEVLSRITGENIAAN